MRIEGVNNKVLTEGVYSDDVLELGDVNENDNRSPPGIGRKNARDVPLGRCSRTPVPY